jgi:hypothetical protein
MGRSWREQLVLRSINEAKDRPTWIKSARLATTYEDQAGKDIVVTTDVGDLYVQVLSAKTSTTKWLGMHGHRSRICIVKFGRNLMNKPLEVWTRVLASLGELYLRVQAT